tara:strand:- start:306 stop:872 length:567 start_codon:yes stop_codon:yes gene_type:complete
MNTRKKRSAIWLLPDDEMKALVKSSESLSDILRFLGFKNVGGNFGTLKSRLDSSKISYQHIIDSQLWRSKRPCDFNRRIPLEDILVKDSTFSRRHLKSRIIEEKLIEYKCFKCGLGPEWNNEVLSLQLDHKNGVFNDHRIENLSFLCPNCHSQTPTFGGRKNKKHYNCKDCGVSITKYAKTGFCRKCA